MPLLSNWKLTFDPAGTPRVLLDFGEKLAEEISFQGAKGLEVVDLTDAASPFLRPSGNNVVTFSWELWRDAVSDAQARADALNGMMAIIALGRRPLRIQLSGFTGGYWQFANACITEHSALRRLESPTPRYVQTFSATCTGLSYTATP